MSGFQPNFNVRVFLQISYMGEVAWATSHAEPPVLWATLVDIIWCLYCTTPIGEIRVFSRRGLISCRQYLLSMVHSEGLVYIASPSCPRITQILAPNGYYRKQRYFTRTRYNLVTILDLCRYNLFSLSTTDPYI